MPCGLSEDVKSTVVKLAATSSVARRLRKFGAHQSGKYACIDRPEEEFQTCLALRNGCGTPRYEKTNGAS
jgi:hypothetical protein